jgi:hypothetical protein
VVDAVGAEAAARQPVFRRLAQKGGVVVGAGETPSDTLQITLAGGVAEHRGVLCEVGNGVIPRQYQALGVGIAHGGQRRALIASVASVGDRKLAAGKQQANSVLPDNSRLKVWRRLWRSPAASAQVLRQASRASRSPLNCQRASVGKKLR